MSTAKTASDQRDECKSNGSAGFSSSAPTPSAPDPILTIVNGQFRLADASSTILMRHVAGRSGSSPRSNSSTASSAHLNDVREPHKALRHALRDTREFFQATTAASPRSMPAVRRPTSSSRCRKQADWDRGVLTRYIRHTHPPVQRDMLIGVGPAARRSLGRDCAGRPGPRLRSRRSAPDHADRGRRCRPPFTGSTAIGCSACATGSTGRSWSRSIRRISSIRSSTASGR